MDKAGLNENHKRRLAVAMAMVDAAAAAAEPVERDLERMLELLEEIRRTLEP